MFALASTHLPFSHYFIYFSINASGFYRPMSVLVTICQLVSVGSSLRASWTDFELFTGGGGGEGVGLSSESCCPWNRLNGPVQVFCKERSETPKHLLNPESHQSHFDHSKVEERTHDNHLILTEPLVINHLVSNSDHKKDLRSSSITHTKHPFNNSVLVQHSLWTLVITIAWSLHVTTANYLVLAKKIKYNLYLEVLDNSSCFCISYLKCSNFIISYQRTTFVPSRQTIWKGGK